jgi:hypothetical protein
MIALTGPVLRAGPGQRATAGRQCAAVKRSYDPGSLVRLNQNIDPGR